MAAILIGLVVGLGLCEVVVRILWNNQILKMDNLGVISYEFMRELSDPDVTYDLKPNIDFTNKDYHIVTSADGFRGKQYPVKKSSDVFRIFVVGDSITFGYGIRENRDVYYNVLEDILNKYAVSSGLKTRFEVMGLAAPGYSTYTELSIFKKKGLKYKPDLVIFGYCLNDMRDSAYSYEYATGQRLGYTNPSLIKAPPIVKRMMRKSVLYSYLADKANRLRSRIEAKRQAGKIKDNKNIEVEKKTADDKAQSPKPNPRLCFPEGSEWYNMFIDSHKGKCAEIYDKYVLKDLENLSGKYNFKVAFVIFPAFENDPSYYPEGGIYLFDDVHKTLAELYAKHNFLVLDLKKSLMGREFKDIAMDSFHLTTNGHHIVAEKLFDYIKENFIRSRP